MQTTSTAEVATKGFSVLVHAASGMEKTRLCRTTGNLEKTLILNIENGLLSLRDFNIPVRNITCMKDAYDVLTELKQDNHFEWVCIDSVSELAEMCLKEKMSMTKDGRQAYGWMTDAMLDLIRDFRDLNKNTYFIAKQMAGEHTGLLGPAMPGKQLCVEGKVCISYLFDEIFTIIDKPHEETGQVYRVMQTFRDDQHECKDRSGSLGRWEPMNLQKIHQKITAKQ